MAVAGFYLITYLNGSLDYCEGVALMNHPASSFPVQLMPCNPLHVTFLARLDSGQVGPKQHLATGTNIKQKNLKSEKS